MLMKKGLATGQGREKGEKSPRIGDDKSWAEIKGTERISREINEKRDCRRRTEEEANER